MTIKPLLKYSSSIKRVFIVLTSLFVVAIVVAAAMLATFDPNEYKEQIAREVKTLTKRTLKIDGDIQLSLFPWLGFELQKISLSHVDDPDSIFISLHNAQLKVAFFPLLTRQLQIERVVIDGLNLKLKRDANGHGNWLDLVPQQDDANQPSSGPAHIPALKSISFAGLAITNMQLHWRDETQDLDVYLKNLTLETGTINTSSWEQIALHITTELEIIKPKVAANIEISGRLQLEAAMNNIALNGLIIRLSATSDDLPVEKASLNLSTNIKVNLKKQQYALQSLKIESELSNYQNLTKNIVIKLASDITIDLQQQHYALSGLDFTISKDIVNQPISSSTASIKVASFSANLNTEKLSLKGLLLTLDTVGEQDYLKKSHFELSTNIEGKLQGKQLLKSIFNTDGLRIVASTQGRLLSAPLNFSTDTHLALDLAKQTAILKKLRVKLADIEINAELTVRKLLSQPQISATIKTNTFNLRNFAQQNGIELPAMSNGNALKKVSAEFGLFATANMLTLNQLTLKIDHSTLSGRIDEFYFQPIATKFKLNLDTINVDDYLPADSTNSSATSAFTGNEPITLPIKFLRQLKVQGQLNIAHLELMNIKANKVEMTFSAKNGRLALAPFTLNMYQGRISNRLVLNVALPEQHYDLKSYFYDINIGPLIKDFQGDDIVQGKIKLELDINGTGNSYNALKSALNGSLSFSLKDGAIKGIDIEQMIRQAEAKLQNKQKDGPQQQSIFSSMRGSAKIRYGILRSQDLDIRSPFLRVNGKGEINLKNDTINYTAGVILTKNRSGQHGLAPTKVSGIEIPVRLTGALYSPDINVDISKALKIIARQALRNASSKARKKAQRAFEDKKRAARERLKKEAQKKLKSLFKF